MEQNDLSLNYEENSLTWFLTFLLSLESSHDYSCWNVFLVVKIILDLESILFVTFLENMVVHKEHLLFKHKYNLW